MEILSRRNVLVAGGALGAQWVVSRMLGGGGGDGPAVPGYQGVPAQVLSPGYLRAHGGERFVMGVVDEGGVERLRGVYTGAELERDFVGEGCADERLAEVEKMRIISMAEMEGDVGVAYDSDDLVGMARLAGLAGASFKSQVMWEGTEVREHAAHVGGVDQRWSIIGEGCVGSAVPAGAQTVYSEEELEAQRIRTEGWMSVGATLALPAVGFLWLVGRREKARSQK